MLGISCYGAERFTYVDLVHRLTDLEYLATLPAPGDQCAQWSSYDRKSRYDETSGKYINWDANGDGDGVIGQEGDKLVFAEMQGPGCIWRIWSAAPKEGHVRIYLDGATEPAVDLPFVGYFDKKNAPFNRSAIVHTVSMGWNNYTPIPYQKSCRIVADRGWGAYYHFDYETFPKGTQVPTFKRELTAKENAALDEANEVLADCKCGVNRTPHERQSLELHEKSVGPGETVSLAELKGPGAITSLRLKLDLPADVAAARDLLRELAIQIKWDGEQEPSVWAPLGDFFGTSGTNFYRSLPLGHTAEGWYCNWYMPFAKSAQVELINDGKTAHAVHFEIAHASLSRPAGQLARFHAKWHRDSLLPAEPERRIDWPLLKTEGPGRFVGVNLHIWNPRGGWWGEGDEKFFVDGEKFPSTFGTGSEDYFGYAWCCPTLFTHAYHNQTWNDGNNRGHVAVNRWHIPDSVPFHGTFEGCIEKYYPNNRPTLYAATAYWYLAPGGKDPYAPRPLSERVGYWTPVQAFQVKGALEGEKLKVLGQTAGNVGEQDMTPFAGQWSNDAHLWWTGARPGAKLDLAVPVAHDGTYKLSLQLTKAPDYGIVQLYLDGAKLLGQVDLYHNSVAPSGALEAGTHELTAGEHKLTVEIVGANPRAIKNYMVGLDYVKLEESVK